MNIGVDFDGVIADCDPLKSYVAEQLYGVKVNPNMIKKKFVIANAILTECEYDTLQMEALHKEKYLGLLELVPDSTNSIKFLLDQGHDVKVVTGRYGNSLKLSQAWLNKQGLNIPFISATTIPKKIEVTKNMQIFIDDHLENLAPLKNEVTRLFLYSQPHNLYDLLPQSITRVQSWVDLLSIIKVNF